MGGIVKTLFGGDGDTAQLRAQLAESQKGQRTAFAGATNQEAEADQALSRGRRGRGGRKLLQYLEGQSTLG